MSAPEIRSKEFTIIPPVKEDAPNTILWNEGGAIREVTYLVKSSMGFFQRLKMDDKLWVPIGKGDKTVYLKKDDWAKLTPGEQTKITSFFLTTFQEAVAIAKTVHVETPELGRDVVEKMAKKVKELVKERLPELIAAARSSPKHTSKMRLPDNVGVIRCETTEDGSVKLSSTKGGGRGSFKTMQKMIDFGSAERITVGNRVYAYLKLHDLKTLSPEEATNRIEMLREEIEVMERFQQAGVKNTVQLYHVKRKCRMADETEIEAPVGIMVEWCDLGDTEWITKAPPQEGTSEYDDCIRIAYDAAVGLHSIHDAEMVHGDLKAANLFLKTQNGTIAARWGDFGGSVDVGTDLKVASPAFLAPEQLFGSGKGIATKEGEIWSLGILLLQMFHGKDSNEFIHVYPSDVFSRSRTKEEMETIQRQLRVALAAVKQHLRQGNPIDDLILSCLRARPGTRPSAEAIEGTLKTLLPNPQTPQKSFFSRAFVQRATQEEQRLLDWKSRAKNPPPAAFTIVEINPKK